MALQKTFTAKYAAQLEYNAKNGIDIERYQTPIFNVDPNEIRMIPNVEQPEGLLDNMDAQNDFKSAKALYEAYSGISPLLASSKDFWAYLTHVDLYPYIRERHPRLKEPDFNDGKYVNEHLFYGFGGSIYHPLQGLWWSVKMTIDTESDYPYKYTEYIFRDYGLRITFLGRYKAMRNKEEVIGIFDFVLENQKELFNEYARQRIRWIVQHFNKIGATKQLMSLDRNYYRAELEKMKNVICKIKTDEDVKTL